MSEKVISTVYGLTSSWQIWLALATRYASPSRPRINLLRRQLQTTHQGFQTCSEFIHAAKTIADQLAIARKPVTDENLISFIIGGLNTEFTGFAASYSFATRNGNLSFKDFLSELLNFETLLDNKNQAIPPQSEQFAMFS